MGLGFTKEDWHRQTNEFSGGWQMRLALAKLLLQKPNLLLLDEPTNHLDLEARNWLEEYLQNYPNAFVLISHDRYFLDVTVNKIAEIWNKRFWFYTGNYDKFVAQKTQRNEQLQAAYRNQRERIEQPLPLPGDQGQAGAEPDQGTGKDGADRDSAGREDNPFFVPTAESQRPHCGRV
jgi:ATP-binding cassette subfamily F protein 3